MGLVTVETAAKELGVSPNLVYRMVAKNVIPHYRVGSRIHLDLAEVKTAFKAAS